MKHKINFEVLKGAKDFFVIARYQANDAIVCIQSNKSDANKTVYAIKQALKVLDRLPDGDSFKIGMSEALQTVMLKYRGETVIFEKYSELKNVECAHTFLFNVIDLAQSLKEANSDVTFGG